MFKYNNIRVHSAQTDVTYFTQKNITYFLLTYDGRCVNDLMGV